MSTAIVDINSDIVRKRWISEGLIQKAHISFWAPFTGRTRESVVYMETNESGKDGHTVVFDFTGNLSGKAIRGKNTAFGKGEEKKKFSDKLTVERYRMPVNNGDKFDGVNIGDLSISEHADSRSKLADLFMRFKDQAVFDAGQGNLVTNTLNTRQSPSHIIDLGTTFTFNQLTDIETTIKTSQGFATGDVRRPLTPFVMKDGRPFWLFVIDANMASMLRQDPLFQSITQSADIRGNDNRNISGIIAQMGQLLIIEAPSFFGATDIDGNAGWKLGDTSIEMSGMRQYDEGGDRWTGQTGFDIEATLHSRGLILGASAFQMAMGKAPDYKFKSSQDFDIKSESALETWLEFSKTNLKAENENYVQAKVADLDFGVIAVDVEVP